MEKNINIQQSIFLFKKIRLKKQKTPLKSELFKVFSESFKALFCVIPATTSQLVFDFFSWFIFTWYCNYLFNWFCNILFMAKYTYLPTYLRTCFLNVWESEPHLPYKRVFHIKRTCKLFRCIFRSNGMVYTAEKVQTKNFTQN